jgi:hypothetical protein
VVMPIQTVLPHRGWAYARVHRRLGTDKVLRPDEIAAWAKRLATLAAQVDGPVYVLWGTDHEDQPLRNMAALARAAGDLVLDWKAAVGGPHRSLQAWLHAPPAAAAVATAMTAPARGADGGDGDGGAAAAGERAVAMAAMAVRPPTAAGPSSPSAAGKRTASPAKARPVPASASIARFFKPPP